MLQDDYVAYDALGLAELVRAKAVSPAELVEAAIARIERDNPTVNAVVRMRYDAARAEAGRVDPAAPFAGVPFLLKDLNIQRQPTSARPGAGDLTVFERYRKAGLLMLGHTNTAELGLSCETAPQAFGPTRNPWDLSRSAGGSSGGAAAAVAAGFVPAAHATDGGGSIRIPSSNCGLFGLKPSRGRNPHGPEAGEGWNGLSVHGVISRSVRDSAALLDASHGAAPGDPYAAPAYAGRYLDEVEAEPGRLRIAVQTTTHGGRAIDPDCVAAVESAAALCESLGHHVEAARPPIDEEELKRATRIIVAANLHNALRARGQAWGRPVSPQDVEPITWLWSEEGRSYAAADLAWACSTIHRIGRALGAFFESHDVLLTSTFAAPPLPLGTVDTTIHDFDRYYETLRRYSAFTSLYNCAGVPAASLPLHWTAGGLPVGVQFATRLGEDAALFRLAGQLERARPWFGLTPTTRPGRRG